MQTPATTSAPGAALVTGASGGIGLELSKLLARDGHPLVLVARSKANLERIAADLERQHGVAVRVVAADLSQPGAVDTVVDQVEQAGVTVDLLINNAGVGSLGPFAQSDRVQQLGMLHLNVVALTDLTRRYVEGMVARGHGKILNVSSTAAFQPGPLMAVYYASKAYVLSFSEALANELHGTGVTVTALCPGPTATDFQRRANLEESRLFKLGIVSSADVVARVGYLAMLEGRPVAIPGLANRLLAAAARLAPGTLSAAMVRQTHERA